MCFLKTLRTATHWAAECPSSLVNLLRRGMPPLPYPPVQVRYAKRDRKCGIQCKWIVSNLSTQLLYSRIRSTVPFIFCQFQISPSNIHASVGLLSTTHCCKMIYGSLWLRSSFQYTLHEKKLQIWSSITKKLLRRQQANFSGLNK